MHFKWRLSIDRSGPSLFGNCSHLLWPMAAVSLRCGALRKVRLFAESVGYF
uniref:Uncharacterized protein n=1 Tax=Macrostomum lignano TaxID=282301 RepID=A0A1I8G9D5_9PLAT